MHNPALGPRVLLRQLREVMAGSASAQDRLDKIASLIAANVVAEVCSIYVMRPGRILELYATRGLNKQAVHNTRMKISEGLVGAIARDAKMLNLSDAQSHPNFKYMPETGEELFQSFLGVPILKNGKAIGVLVIQNETHRHYSTDEEEAVQTTAMVLAEIISSGELKDVADSGESDVAHLRAHFRTGEAVAPGIAIGHVVLHEPRVIISNFVAGDVELEKQRLMEAVNKLRRHIDGLITSNGSARGNEYGDILETYRMFANDRGWVRRIDKAIESGLTAEAAVERVQNENRTRFEKAASPYLRARMTDLDDLANRLLRILTGTAQTASLEVLPKDAIVAARSMGAAELLDYDRARLKGLVLQDAGGNAHVSIVARALDIPVVAQISDIIDLVDTGDNIIIDGTAGDIHIRPTADVSSAYVEKLKFYQRKQARFATLRDVPAVTRDCVKIDLNINAGLPFDMPHLVDSGADGVGLFRTELQFMISRSFPRREAQIKYYRDILQQASGKPVVFRALDIGSDKTLPYLQARSEENPALGWRGLRLSLARPALLRLQVRSLLQAAADTELRLMFPFVTRLDEYQQARKIVDQETHRLKKAGMAVARKVCLGVMIEVPSMLWQLDDILPEVDFVSVGSNDLIQYIFSSDRLDTGLSRRYDPLSPVFLRVLRQIVGRCEAHAVPLTLCGEMAGNPLEAMTLVGLGIRSISMAPASIGPVKEMILSLDREKLSAFLEPLVDTPVNSLRRHLKAYARGNKVAI